LSGPSGDKVVILIAQVLEAGSHTGGISTLLKHRECEVVVVLLAHIIRQERQRPALDDAGALSWHDISWGWGEKGMTTTKGDEQRHTGGGGANKTRGPSHPFTIKLPSPIITRHHPAILLGYVDRLLFFILTTHLATNLAGSPTCDATIWDHTSTWRRLGKVRACRERERRDFWTGEEKG